MFTGHTWVRRRMSFLCFSMGTQTSTHATENTWSFKQSLPHFKQDERDELCFQQSLLAPLSILKTHIHTHTSSTQTALRMQFIIILNGNFPLQSRLFVLATSVVVQLPPNPRPPPSTLQHPHQHTLAFWRAAHLSCTCSQAAMSCSDGLSKVRRTQTHPARLCVRL